jgi:hypothetical protein
MTIVPLYLLDELLSYKFAPVFQSLGFNMTCVEDEFGRRGVDDPDIIKRLGTHNPPCHAVWITEDWEATKLHAKTILTNQISVWWIREGKHSSLTGIQELQLISLVIELVSDTVCSSKTPTYLKASLLGRRPHLFRLKSHLMSPRLDWERIPLP